MEIISGGYNLRMVLYSFAKNSLKNVTTMKVILRFFELTSSLKIIFLKSKLTGIGVSNERVDFFASILNCRVMNIPFMYREFLLGLIPQKKPLGSPLFKSSLRNLIIGSVGICLLVGDYAC